MTAHNWYVTHRGTLCKGECMNAETPETRPFAPNIPLVYIAGPYIGKAQHHDYRSYGEIDANINRARTFAAWLTDHGLYFFCPHLNSAHFEVITPNAPPEYWYALDFRILSHCDAMYVLRGWEDSKGTIAEIAYCREKGIPVFFEDGGSDERGDIIDYFRDPEVGRA